MNKRLRYIPPTISNTPFPRSQLHPLQTVSRPAQNCSKFQTPLLWFQLDFSQSEQQKSP